MNLYYQYHGVGFSCEQFLEFTREHPGEFIRYCEVLITENGIVYLASPSHEVMDGILKKKGFNGVCWVWYDNLRCERLTEKQQAVLQELRKNNLINDEVLEVANKMPKNNENVKRVHALWEIEYLIQKEEEEDKK